MRQSVFIVSAVLVAAVFFTPHLSADTGIGFIVGEPTGLSLKINRFPVIAVAWSLDDYFQIHVDYWLKTGKLEHAIHWYIGLGAKVRVNGDANLGFRVPIGLYHFFSKKFELFGELAPGILLIDETKFDVGGGIGLRYHF
jgi:hypothetical protein